MPTDNKETVVRRRRHVCFGEQETNEERCHRLNRFYQARYPEVQALHSADLVRSFDRNSTVLVDVRTGPERKTSTIEGSISLQEFERNAVVSLPPDAKVVTFCTIGYRSGLEARRLQYQYSLEGRISSLDGIVAYTHAISKEQTDKEAPKLVCPETGSTTAAVHTFGQNWDCVAADFEPQHFAPPTLLVRLSQVGGLVVMRSLQYVGHRLKQCVWSDDARKAE